MKVQVYAYDLTRGMAAALSPMLLGYQVEAVWHTAVIIDGRQEIFFGYGINKARAGCTMFGQPVRVLDMGETEVTADVLEELLSDLEPRFRPHDYNLLFHNCNTFSNELVQLLTGESLPDYIMCQAEHLFNTPWGESLMPMIMAMEGFTGSATATGTAAQQQHPTGSATQSAATPTPAPAAFITTPAVTTVAAGNASGTVVQAVTEAAGAEAAATRPQETQPDQGHEASSKTLSSDGISSNGDPGGARQAEASSARANAAMAAMARATQQQQQQQQAGAIPSKAAEMQDAAEAVPVRKTADGIAGLNITADSRTAQQ